MPTRFTREVVAGNQLVENCQYTEQDPRFVLVGTDGASRPLNIPVGEQMLSRHILMLGGIGTGKSNGFCHLIRNIRHSMGSDDVMVVFDTKGDYLNEFKREGDIVISNDSRACGPVGPDYWNIFNEIRLDGDIESDVSEIASTLFADKCANTSQPFFPNAAKDLFQAMMLHMIRNPSGAAYRNNAALRSAFDGFICERMKTVLDAYPDLHAMRSYIEDEKSGQTLGVVSELQQLVREIFVGNFKQIGSLSLRQLVREHGGKVIFVEYDLGVGSVLAPIYQLLIDLAIKETLCRTTNRGNVFFVLDEFRLLPHLQHVEDGINFGRSLGAKFIVGVQNISQMYAAYGQDVAKSILSGFGTTFAFRVTDSESREYVKGLFGENLQLQTYLSSVQNRGISEQLQTGSVLEDSDILNLGLGEAVVATPACEPFFFKFRKF